MTRSIWTVLGIAATRDPREIRRAYASRLKTVHPEDDPEGFQALRQAYDAALSMARSGGRGPAGFEPRRDPGPADPGPGPEQPDPEPQTRRPRPAPPAPMPVDPEEAAALQAEAEVEKAHQQSLSALTRTARDPEAGSEAVVAALMAVLRSPAMTSLSRHGRVERRIAQLILEGGRGADAILEPASAYFGWNDPRIDVNARGPDLGEQIRMYRARRAEVDRILTGRSSEALGLALLERPMTWRARLEAMVTARSEKRVLAFFSGPGPHLPEISERLNGATADWWRKRLDRPRLSPKVYWFLGVVILLATVAAVVTAQGAYAELGSTLSAAAAAVLLWLMIVAPVAVVIGLWRGVMMEWRWRSARGDPWAGPRWRRTAWAWIVAGLSLMAPIVPPDWPFQLAYVLALAGPVATAWAVGDDAGRRRPQAKRLSLLGALPALLFAWMLSGMEVRAQNLLIAALACLAAEHFGRRSLSQEWIATPDAVRIRIGRLVFAVTPLLALGLVFAPPGMARVAVATVVVVLFMFARPVRHTQPATAIDRWAGWARLGWLIPIIAVLPILESQPAAAITIGPGLWVLGGVAITAAFEAFPGLDARLRLPIRKRRRGADRFG